MKVKKYIKDRINQLNEESKASTNPLDRLVIAGKIIELLQLLELSEKEREE